MATTTAQTVQSYYQNILFRAGDQAGVQYWTNQIDNVGYTDVQVENQIATSTEAQTYVAPIVQLYEADLGRAPDVSGLSYWVHQAESGMSLSAIDTAIQNSSESKAYSGTITASNASDFVTKLYQNILDRAPDSAGLSYWVQQLTATTGALTAGQVEDALRTSAEAQTILPTATTNYLMTIGSGGTVTGTIFNTSGAPGQTFTLTAGVDNLTGTAGNDTFVGTVTGAASQTLNPGDSINGAGGTNTLKIVDTQGKSSSNDLAGVTLSNVQTVSVQNASTSDVWANFSQSPGVSKVVALNTTTYGQGDYFSGLATGTQVIASGSGSGLESGVNPPNYYSWIAFGMANPSDAVSVGVDGGVNGVSFYNDYNGSSPATAATITSTGAANGTVANPDYFLLTDYNASLKTLTVNATTNLVAELNSSDYVSTGAALTVSGSAASVNLAPSGSSPNFKTINASQLAGGLTITTGAALTSLTGGAGNDVVTLGVPPTAAATIDLGGGNNKLLGAVGAAPTASGTTINGGSGGTNTLSSALVTASNGSDFSNFQTLSLQGSTPGTLDTSLIKGITGLSVDTATGTATYTNLATSDTLTDNFVGNNSAAVNTLNFSGLSGTSNAYTIAFNGAAQTSVPTSANVQLGEVDASGINNFTINSGGGANTWNSLILRGDAAANTVKITGSQNLDLSFVAGFGSTSSPNTGVTSIDGSAATGNLTINDANLTPAAGAGGSSLVDGLTITGGSGNDNLIAVNNDTLAGGAGKNVFDAMQFATNSTTDMASITDFTAGTDKLVVGGAADTFTSKAASVGTATDLTSAINNVISGMATGTIDWFNYGSNTYVLEDQSGGATFATGTDHVVQMAGKLDLSSLTASHPTTGLFAGHTMLA